MRTHLAILHARYLGPVLDGGKRVEARLSMTRRAPYGVVFPGDRVVLKRSGGPIGGEAVVGSVLTLDALTPARVRALGRALDHDIGAGPAFWERKSGARYATLICLDHVRRVDDGSLDWALGTIPRGSRSAWHLVGPEPRARSAG